MHLLETQKRKKILYVSYDGILDSIVESQIISYLEKDQPFECSGSYRYESLGADLFSSVLGSEFAIQGLAISPLLKAFKDLGLDIKY